MGGVKMTIEELGTIKRLLNEGKTTGQIGRMLGRHPATIFRIAKKGHKLERNIKTRSTITVPEAAHSSMRLTQLIQSVLQMPWNSDLKISMIEIIIQEETYGKTRPVGQREAIQNPNWASSNGTT